MPPQNGFCADSRCDREVKRLYECHCCLQSICLNHLNEHDEKEKNHYIIEDLRTKAEAIRTSIDNRLKIIERETIFVEQENKFLERANHLLNGQHQTIEDIQKMLGEFDQLVQLNNFRKSFQKHFFVIHSSFLFYKDCVVKVEPMLSDETNCSESK